MVECSRASALGREHLSLHRFQAPLDLAHAPRP
jgi:hypothetical protein